MMNPSMWRDQASNICHQCVNYCYVGRERPLEYFGCRLQLVPTIAGTTQACISFMEGTIGLLETVEND